jgi:hypothetical protein
MPLGSGNEVRNGPRRLLEEILTAAEACKNISAGLLHGGRKVAELTLDVWERLVE